MSHRQGTLSAALVLLAILAVPGLTVAAPREEECPAGNLLRADLLVDSLDVAGDTRVVLDDSVAVEGTAWTRVHGVTLETAAAALTFDLGRSVSIEAAYVQADARNSYSLQVSEDGEHFDEIWRAVPGAGEKFGLRSAIMVFSETKGRFIRFGEPTGVGSGFISELHVYCRVPDVWPPAVVTVRPSQGESKGPRGKHWYSEKELSRFKLALALLGVGVLIWGRLLARRRFPSRWARVCDVLLLALGIAGFWGYFNWAPYLRPIGTHYYEFYHYYLGSKYFPELGYTGLYDCTCLAEVDLGFRRRVEHRTIRNLRDNRVVPADYVLEDPEHWKHGFLRPWTPERWEAFKRDVVYFRAHVHPVRWERMLQDHGYNPSPVWNLTGSFLANTGPASEPLIEGKLRWIDPSLIVLTFACILWAFGWRVACIAALFFGTNDLGSHFWVGGAYLRMDWFFWAIAGLCLLKRGHPLLGGAGLGVSALLRIFPVCFFVPVVLRLVWVLYRERRLDRAATRILVGAALAAAVLIPVSSRVAGGWAAWPEFLRNTAKQTGSPMTNHVGLRTVLAFQWDARQKVTYDPTSVDPFEGFREARTKAFRGNVLLFAFLGLGYLALLLYALRREKDAWAWAVFGGFGVIPISMELTGYYYSCLITAAFLWEKRPRIAVGLVLLSALGQIVTLQTYFYDIRFYLHSVLLVAFAGWTVLDYARRRVPPGAGSGPSFR